MQRIPNGVTDQYIYFFAVDSTDLITPETGLSSFTVRRSRNGGASAAMTTPTINETDSSNMPGWYELLMDEDTTLDSGDHSQIMALHITQASMAPAKVLVEIYRPDVTAGETLTVASGIGSANIINAAGTAWNSGAINVNTLASNTLTNAKINSGAFTSGKFDVGVYEDIAGYVWAETVRTLSALDEDSTTLDLDATIRSAIGLASANLDTQIADLPTANENADALLDRSAGVETGLTFRQWLRLAASTLFGKASGLETTTAVFRDFGDTKDRITATVDANGNRTAVTRDAT